MMNSTFTRILAFDFGLKRIGVATGQTITGTTQMLSPLSAREGQPDWDLVQKLLREWQPQLLLVGVPLAIDGSDLSVTPNARKFIKRLQGRFGLPVLGVDERVSTKEARQQLFDYGGYKKLQQHSVDSLAAELILQQWLNEQAQLRDADDNP
jgi:putative Holliday junction resolvase